MTPSQKRLRELKDRQSRERQRMAELSLLDDLDTETRAELDTIETGTPDLERQLRARRDRVRKPRTGPRRSTPPTSPPTPTGQNSEPRVR